MTNISVKLDRDYHQRLKALAKHFDCSVHALAIYALNQWLIPATRHEQQYATVKQRWHTQATIAVNHNEVLTWLDTASC